MVRKPSFEACERSAGQASRIGLAVGLAGTRGDALARGLRAIAAGPSVRR
jgi:hypothetical protein